MNYKTTIGLVILLAIVGAYVFFVERNKPAASPPGSNTTHAVVGEGEPLFSTDQLAVDNVDRVTLQRGDDHYTFEKQGTDWYQTEPVRFKLSPWSVSSLVDQAASLKRFDTLKDKTIDNPTAVVTIHDATNDKTHTLRLGDATISGRAMATFDDNATVLLVNDNLHNAVRRLKINDMRAKVLDAPGPAQADSLLVTRDAGSLALHKSTEGLWFLDDAHTERADPAAAERLINAFAKLGLNTFVADKPADLVPFGLDQPRMTITLTTPDRTVPGSDTVEPGDHIALHVGRAADLDAGTFFALRTNNNAGGEVVFTVTRDVLAPFEASADTLRDPALFTAKSADVRAFAVSHDGNTLKLERDTAGRFNFVQPTPSFGVDYNDTTALIDMAAALKADKFDPAFQPAAEPAARITLNDQSAALYPADSGGGGYWALREGEHVAYHITSDAVAPLLAADAAALRNRTVLDLQPPQITAVTLTRPGDETLRFTRSDTGWKLEGHPEYESNDFAQLLVLLAPLRAQTWTGPDAEPGDVLAEAKIQTDEGSTHTLTLAANCAFVEGADDTFTLGAPLRSRLTAEYRPRTLIQLLPEDLASVTREHADASQTVKLERNQFTWNSSDKLHVPAAAALFETLAGLHADHFVTHQTFAAETPAWTFTLTPRDGITRTVKLMSDNRTATMEPGPQSDADAYRAWFTLDDATVKTLTAPLTEAAQPLPDAADLIESK